MYVANDSVYICNLGESLFNIAYLLIYSIHELVVYTCVFDAIFSFLFVLHMLILKNCAYYG